jgi:hypothetical protein
MNENDFLPEGSSPVEVDGIRLEKEHFKLIFDLARDQCRDPYEYLESLLKWMREQGYGPHE